ncbi:MAG: HEAT repeat domain-containing protein [Candidatus Electrothrix scaldis]|nr:MAG: HEAT repeat domain-containing protein [Candidatus Electrothrix sp. GW3-3]
MNFLFMLLHKIRPVAGVLAVVGLAAAIYYAFDLIYPNHFVGDMYGLEVMFRGCLLLTAGLTLMSGLLMTLIGWKKEMPKLIDGGLLLADLCSVLLIVLAFNVYRSRAVDEIRKTYPQKSTTELIRIAVEEKDQFAIYEILARKDHAAVPALIDLLLDEEQDSGIRLEAAHALGQLGGVEARVALEKAAAMPGGNSYLAGTIRYSLEHIERLEQKKREER